jgi:uncharacterized Fe-S cluster protein YjdI
MVMQGGVRVTYACGMRDGVRHRQPKKVAVHHETRVCMHEGVQGVERTGMK